MLQLNQLVRGGEKDRKRIGRGGDRGGTSGKGHKGQKARTGSAPEIKPTFEGGQMPLSRRLPKRGFYNAFKKDVRIVNLNDLETKFSSGDLVNKETLVQKGLLKGKGDFLVKVLGNGNLTKKLTVSVNFLSKGAADAVLKAGGKLEAVKESERDSSIA